MHDLVCRVLNACFNARPPHPRYVVTWDRSKTWRAGVEKPQLLLSYIRPHTEVVPCTIAGWLRSSDLRARDIRYMSINENSISFELGQLTKSRRKGQPPIKLNFDRYDSDPLVCVVSMISYYLDRSKTWRSGVEKPQLLLSYIRPHTEVVPCTIVGWLVELMSFVLLQPEVHLPLSLKPKASPNRRFWLWLTGRKNPPFRDIT